MPEPDTGGMNTRSLRFRLIFWYASLLMVCFGFLGVATYLSLRSSLINAVQETLLRRARQIAQLVSVEAARQVESQIGPEIEARYSPGSNNRFVRVTRDNGRLVYLSSLPPDHGFDPAVVPGNGWPGRGEAVHQVTVAHGRQMLLTAHGVEPLSGVRYLVETGATLDGVQSDLRKWRAVLLAMLPVVAAIALGGGFLLVRQSLLPVDRIAATAERISSQNLSERLPVPQTGDELERLSLSLNRMIQRLETSFQYSRRFVADASHELRTPLTVLRGELETLAQEPNLTPAWRDRLGSTLEEVERLTSIVEGLFAISRLDAGEAATEWLVFDLAPLVTGTADQMALLADDKQIQVRCDAPTPVWIAGDRARMKQVVVNLLDNAIKYTQPGGMITLTVRALDAKAVIEVADNGAGIPAEALPRVFDRFFRVDPTRSRERGGAGLGLSIVRSICAAHQGEVTVESAPGQGSRFRVTMPRLSVPAAANVGDGPVMPGAGELPPRKLTTARPAQG